MLRTQQIAPMKNANVLIFVPETSKQPSWEVCNLQPEEYEIVIKRKDTKQIETIKAWILNLNGTNYTVIQEVVNIIVDAAPSIDMCIELEKAICRQDRLQKNSGRPEGRDQVTHLEGTGVC